jgi:hypothetical protein
MGGKSVNSADIIHMTTNRGFTPLMLLAALCLILPIGIASASPEVPPVFAVSPSKARSAVVRAAESVLGKPYVLGGENLSGFDCSGLVYYSFNKATGFRVPRTVQEQIFWVMPVPKSAMRPGDLVFFDLEASGGAIKAAIADIPAKVASSADHVGIYAGEGTFIHAASAGSRRGVTVDRLADPSWSRRFLFAGRALPVSLLSGIAVETGFGLLLDSENPSLPEIRGGALWLGASFPLGTNFSIGMETRPAWDALLGTARIPLELVIGQTSGLQVFAGPAFNLGQPRLASGTDLGSPARDYLAVDSWLASTGLRWSPTLFRIGDTRVSLFSEIRFDRYLPASGLAEDNDADRKAIISFGAGLKFRTMRY